MKKVTESKCPHCNGSLERWEDPKAVLIITTLTAENERLREALEKIAREPTPITGGNTERIIKIAQTALKTKGSALPTTELREGRPPAFQSAEDGIGD